MFPLVPSSSTIRDAVVLSPSLSKLSLSLPLSTSLLFHVSPCLHLSNQSLSPSLSLLHDSHWPSHFTYKAVILLINIPFPLARKGPITSLHLANPPHPSGYRSDISPSKNPLCLPYQLPQVPRVDPYCTHLTVLLQPQLACKPTRGKNSASFIAVSPVAAIWEGLDKCG